MESKNRLLSHLNQLHTTKLGQERIKRNLDIHENDIVPIIKEKMKDKNGKIYRRGKNWYCEIQNIKITINSNNYCIITAHPMKLKNKKT